MRGRWATSEDRDMVRRRKVCCPTPTSSFFSSFVLPSHWLLFFIFCLGTVFDHAKRCIAIRFRYLIPPHEHLSLDVTKIHILYLATIHSTVPVLRIVSLDPASPPHSSRPYTHTFPTVPTKFCAWQALSRRTSRYLSLPLLSLPSPLVLYSFRA